MTVSPQWPQDGDRQPKAAGNGAELDSTSAAPALPPTLFKLPNLKRNHESQDPNQHPPSPNSPLAETPTSSGSEYPSVDAAGRETTENPNTSETASTQKRPNPAPIRPDEPAGRSWMETFGSHGLVVVLLLVVIGAALLSGRKSPSPEFESLVEYEPVDDRFEVELPIPLHGPHESTGPDESTGLASSAGVESPTQNLDPGLSPLQSEQTVSNPIAESFPHFQSALTPEPPLEARKRPLVSLEPPQPTFSIALRSQGTDLGAPQANKYLSEPGNIDALAAAKRFEIASPNPTLPTLKDLADEYLSTDDQNATEQTGPTYQLSPTPAGITDWSRYFPVYEPRSSADSATPSTSK
jgi:hypothetical protein